MKMCGSCLHVGDIVLKTSSENVKVTQRMNATLK